VDCYLHACASTDRFIEFEIGSFSERLHESRLLVSTSPCAATSMHRGRRPRRPGSTSACAAISARGSNVFDYFDFAGTIGSSPTTTSTTRLDLKTSRNRFIPVPTSRASSTNHRSFINELHGFVDIHPRIKLSDLYLFRLVLHKIGYLFWYASRRA
jgi:hypothetical protein